MASKLTFHFQLMTHWAVDVLKSAPFGWCKCMFHNPGDVGQLPTKTIGRIWIGGEGVEGDYIRRREAGADDYFARCLPFYRASPWVHAWESVNEPGVGKSSERQDLAAFTRRWVELMHQAGLRTVAYCISVGNPPGSEAEVRQAMKELGPGLAATDYWSYHAYWAGDIPPEGEWHALRYRMLVRYLREAGYRVPPLLLTEAGVDGGVKGVGRTGWVTWCKSEAQYMAELKRFDAELAKDDYVQCATLFTAGPNADWMDFEVTESLAKLVAAHVRAQAGPEPEPEEEPVTLGPDPNVPYWHSYRPSGATIQGIVWHGTEGPLSAALDRFKDPKETVYKPSAHAIVTRAGEVVTVVPWGLCAHHAGYGKLPWYDGNPNDVTIGIELECAPAPAGPGYTEVQLAAAAELGRSLVKAFEIPREHHDRHGDIDPTRRSDPRGIEGAAWESFLDRLYPEADMDPEIIRNAAWAAQRIAYNPDAAFPRYARTHALGNPVTAEVDVDGYRVQGYSGGIVYARIGDWSNCRHTSW